MMYEEQALDLMEQSNDHQAELMEQKASKMKEVSYFLECLVT